MNRIVTPSHIAAARQAIEQGGGKCIVQLGGRTARTEQELEALILALTRDGAVEGIEAEEAGGLEGDAPKRDDEPIRLALSIPADAAASIEASAIDEELQSLGEFLRQHPDDVIILTPGSEAKIYGAPLVLDLGGMNAEEVQALIETLQNWDGDMVHPLVAMTQVEARIVEWGERGTEEEHLVRDVYLGPWRTPTSEDGERLEMEGEPGEGIQLPSAGEQLPPAHGPISGPIGAPSDEDALPKDFPGRRPLEQAGYTTLTAIRPLTVQNLIDLPGIGDATAKQIAERVAASLAKATVEEAV
jgi:hypothetical protein